MSASRDDTKTKRLAIALGALGLLSLLGLLWLQRENGATQKAAAAPSVSTTFAGQAPAPPSLPTTTTPSIASASAMPSSLASDLAIGGAEHIKQALEQYESFSRFPPWSRPADGSQTHLWKWNAPDPMGQAFGNDGKGKKISGELVLDRMFAGPGDTITATVTVWRGGYEDPAREPMDASVSGFVEAWRDAQPQTTPPTPAGYVTVATVSFSSLPGGPGRRYVAKFVPSTIEALKTQGETRFVASVDPDGHPFPFAESFRYAATEPLVVLDKHSDAIVEGSLQVTVAMDIKRLGPVLVQATLFDATGATPIAIYDDYYRPTQLGPQDVKITFFGKAIGDKRVDGPYSVRALHGFVRILDGQPPEIFWQSTTPIATGSYKATDFSNREWDSPEKTEKINQYKRMLASLGSK